MNCDLVNIDKQLSSNHLVPNPDKSLVMKIGSTVPLRTNLTGNANANGYRIDTEQVREHEWNGYRTDIEQISNGHGAVMDQKKGKKHYGTQTIRERVLQNTR